MSQQKLEETGSGPKRPFGPGMVVLVAVIALAFFGPMKAGADTDFWWHLATGQEILQEGSLPQTDPYSWSAQGRGWVVQEWGSEVIFAAVYSISGAAGLVVMEGLVIGALALLLLLILRRYTHDPYVLGGVILIVISLSTLLWTIRPHLFTLLLFSVVLWLLTGYDEEPSRAWWLVPLFLLWVNLHAAFVIGLALIGVFAIVRSATGRGHALWPVLGACLLAGCVNPAGPAIYLHPFRVLGASRRVLEWMPPDLHDPASLIFAMSALGGLTVLALRRKQVSPELVLCATLFSLTGFAAMRNIPFAGVALAPVLAIGLDGAIGKREAPGIRESVVLMSLASLFVLAGLMSAVINVGGADEQELFREKAFPRDAVEVLKEHPVGRVANPWGWGGYLIFRAPGYPISFDGRNDMYGRSIVDKQLLLEDLSPGWDEYLEENSVRYVLWQRTRPLAEALRLDEGWRLLHEDRLAVLFERVGS